MNILMEGLDNVGKSTQIRLLLPKLIDKPTQCLHYSNIKGLTCEQCIEYSTKLYIDMFELMKQSSHRNLLFDRAHVGEFVYGPIYRKYSGDYIFDIENKYNHYSFWKDTYIIVFIDDIENLIAREDGLSFSINPEIKQQEVNKFVEFYERTSIKKKLLMNIKGKSIEQVHEEICKFLGV